jgi:cell pole-organizing protein PopZ
MRRTLTLCRNGLSVAAAVVVLTACGGSGNDGGSQSPASSETSSSASETSAPAADSEFCSQSAEALSKVEPAFTGQGGDPTSLAPGLREAADQIRAIQAPSEIAADWTALADGLEQLAGAFADSNLSDPASKAALQQRTTEIIGQLSTPAMNVQTYLGEQCGLETPSTDPAAPTS